MLYIGLGFLLDWVLMTVFNLEVMKSALITAVVFIILGLLVEGIPNGWPKRNP